MKIAILVSALLIIASIGNTEIYKWRDAEGKLHFSDRQPQNSQSEKVHTTDNTYKGREPEPSPDLTKTRRVSPRTSQKTVSHKRITADDYTVSKSIYQKRNGIVEVSGRISRGPACNNLKVELWARNSSGGIIHITDMTSYSGFGSKRFEGTDTSHRYSSEWFVSSFFINCLD